VVGNCLSLLVGLRCRRHMSSLERSATAGLVALVTSDLLFCAAGLPQLFVSEDPTAATPDSVTHARFTFYYQTNFNHGHHPAMQLAAASTTYGALSMFRGDWRPCVG